MEETEEETIARLTKLAEEQETNKEYEQAFLNYVAILMRNPKDKEIAIKADNLMFEIGSSGKYHNIYQVICKIIIDS
ncbi:MAG: hypothetical protein LBC75_00065 [Fibromonadaceae bacterium]|jgi:maltooligosyltrehalose synthase|nr:hypothetical protein [Fibromonadaceae bacterium]